MTEKTGEGDFEEKLRRLRARDPRYPAIGYAFVLEGLDFTIRRLGRNEAKGEARHVSGRELVAGLRDFARAEFGPLARAVLGGWNITRTEDFGEIVFNLVEEQLLSRREEDTKEDFRDGYDFAEAFEKGYKIETGGEEP